MTGRAQEHRNSNWGVSSIRETAARLEIPEFDVFALAYRWWFGRPARPRMLEPVFAAYMFGGVVPPWARQYAREVLRELHENRPDLARLGLDRLRPDRPPRHGRMILAAVFTSFALLAALILDIAPAPDHRTVVSAGVPAGPMAMSCAGGGPGLRFFESLAHQLSGRDLPTCD